MTEPTSGTTAEVDDLVAARADKRDLRFLLFNAASLVLTTAVTTGLGFVYWAVGAHFFTAQVVGGAATAVSAMTFIAGLCTLGFGTMLMVRLPGMTARRFDLLVTTVGLSTVAGVVVATLAALAFPVSVLGLPHLGSSPLVTGVFAAGVGVTAASLVLDQGLLSVLGGGPQLARNVTLSVGKLVMLFVLVLPAAGSGELVLYGSWLVANAASIVAMVAWARWRGGVPVRRPRPSLALTRGLRKDAAGHHVLNLALQMPYSVMPIVASVVLGAADAGYLYATWAIAGFVFVLPLSLSRSLVASGVRRLSGFSAQLRLTLRFSVAAWVLANVGLLVLGGLVLRFYGPEYAQRGRLVLLLVCLGGLGVIVKDHHVSVARVVGRVGREAALVWTFSIAEMVLAAIGARLGGLQGLAAGWLCATLVEGLVYLPLVWRARSGRLPAPAGPRPEVAGGPVP